jgi:CheY-like chemotaxis protein
VLIAEDDELNQILLGEMFKKIGIEYQLVSNGREALEYFEQFHYEVVILDRHMPVMGGKEAAQAIRQKAIKDRKTVKIVVLSGDKPSRHQEEVQWFDVWLQKPFSFDSLEKEMAKLSQMGSSSEGQEDQEIQKQWNELVLKIQEDSVFYQNLFYTFESSIIADLISVKALLYTRENKALYHVIHKIKGELSIFAGLEGVSYAKRLEKALKNNENHQEIQEVFEELKLSIDKLIFNIKKILKELIQETEGRTI